MSDNIIDWDKIVLDAVKHITDAGFLVEGAWDGEDYIHTTDAEKATKHVTACDDGSIYFIKDGNKYYIVIVLGNLPEEIVSDYSYHVDAPPKDKLLLDNAVQAHYDSYMEELPPVSCKH